MPASLLCVTTNGSNGNAKKRKNMHAEETLLTVVVVTSTKENEIHWLRRDENPLHHKAVKQELLMGIWRFIGSACLQNLAVRNIIDPNSMPCDN
eukprot:678414-Pelagomonas_calceolata.AAC.1